MKTAISISDSLFEQAESTAKKLGVSRSNLFSRAIEEFLANYNPADVTEKLNEIYKNDQASLDSTILQMQINSIDRETW